MSERSGREKHGEKMRKKCELCGDRATMYCESDTASLCLRCDEEVHGANFLVAKHERRLLCSVCQEVTSWKASGPRLGRTVSVCDGCVCARSGGGVGGGGKVEVKEDEAEVEEVESRDDCGGDGESYASSDGEEEEEEDEDEDDDDEEEEIEEDDDEENQVVPWSIGEEVSSSSNGGGETDRKLKRRRASSDLDSDEIETGGGSSSATEQSDRGRATSRLIGLNRYPDGSLSELKRVDHISGKAPKTSFNFS